MACTVSCGQWAVKDASKSFGGATCNFGTKLQIFCEFVRKLYWMLTAFV